jgi:SAM-dependent MidA family methyltransferase
MVGPEERLKKAVKEAGAVSFAVFMEEALYGADGYYDRQELAIGPEGDFVTGSALSPLFGCTTATLLRRLDGALAAPADYFEVAYGGGEHLAAVMAALDEEGTRRVWAWDRVARPLPAEVKPLGSLSDLGHRVVRGLVFSYELFDALPVHRLVRRGEGLQELLVTRDGSGFGWLEGPLSDPRLKLWNDSSLEEGQIADVTPEWGVLYRELARRLDCGLVVTCDYGFSRRRLLDARVRRHGTLSCYREHRVHRNPFVDIGRQDLTAHVDFTTLIESGEDEGLETVGLFRQAEWLAATGILDGMSSRSPEERIEVMELMNLEGMGEEIRVLVQSRGVDAAEVLPLLA